MAEVSSRAQHNHLIFETIRDWLDHDGFTQARILELDSALAAFDAAPANESRNGIVFSKVRPWLDEQKFIGPRITALDAALANYLAQSPSGPGLAGAGTAIATPPPAPAPATHHGFPDQAGEDRFFEAVRKSGLFLSGLNQSQVNGIKAKLAAFAAAQWPLAYAAYAMETSHHETGQKMQPVPEGGKGRGRAYGRPGKHHGQIAYGRGDVQLTWDYNYEAMDEDLGLNGSLIANYERALEPEISARIMVNGMSKGRFTTRKLSTYLPTDRPATFVEFRESRRIINGTDRWIELANNALKWQACFQAGGWA